MRINKGRKTTKSIVNLQPKKRTHWVGFVHKYCFDSFACAPVKNFLISEKVNTEKIFFWVSNSKVFSFCGCSCSIVFEYIFFFPRVFKTTMLVFLNMNDKKKNENSWSEICTKSNNRAEKPKNNEFSFRKTIQSLF